MGLTISNALGSAVSDYGVQILSPIPTPSKSITRSLQSKASRRRRKAFKRRLRRLLRRRGRGTHNRLGEPVPIDRTAPRSVVGLNQDPLNLRKDLRVGSFNTRTLKASWRLEEACYLASKRKIDILCVQEHRIRVPASAETTPHQRNLEGGWLFCHASARQDLAHGGVGVLLSPKLIPLLEGQPVVNSDRIMKLTL